MKQNSTIIRPSPGLIEKVMRSLREELNDYKASAFFCSAEEIKPSVRTVDERGSMVRMTIDRRLGDRISIEPHGSWFDVSFGEKCILASVSEASKDFARRRYDRSRSDRASGDIDSSLLKIILSCRIGELRSEYVAKPIDAFDFAGNRIKVVARLAGGNVVEFGGIAGRDEEGVDFIYLIVGRQMTLGEIGERWPEAKRVLLHELGHTVDPGRVLQKYGGGPKERIRKLGFDSIEQAEIAESQFISEGDEASARMAAEAISRAYSGYAGDPQEIRAESTAILYEMRKWIVTEWLPEHVRPLPSSMVWGVIRRRSRGTPRGRWLAWMEERDQAKLLAYVTQALMEEGLVS